MTNPYTELHCHSYYSLLDGASSPEALVGQAVQLGMTGLALTDHDNLYGAVAFYRAALDQGLHPIIGSEVTVEGHHLTVLAEDQRGYSNLSHLLTLAHCPDVDLSPWPGKATPSLTWEQLNTHRLGLIVLSGCRRGPIAAPILAGQPDAARRAAGRLLEIFGNHHLYIELQRHILPSDTRLIYGLVEIAHYMGIEVVATNNVHYATPDKQRLQDVLTSIRHLQTLDEAHAHGLLRPNTECYLKSPMEMARLFAAHPQAILNTRRVAERCQVRLDFSQHRLPAFPVSTGHTPFSLLYTLVQAGLAASRRLSCPRRAAS